MKIINIMNFVRQCDPRMDDSERILHETTASQVALVKEYGLDSTFLLQYDAGMDPLIRNCSTERRTAIWS